MVTVTKPQVELGAPALWSDRELQRRVIDELRWDSDIDDAAIQVTVDNGTVTLSGTVGQYGEKIEAQKAAHRVAGVRDVANDIEVGLGGEPIPEDTRIAQVVRAALEWDARVPHRNITSTVSDGIVTLEGTVERWIERYRAELAVLNLMGVRGVVNKIVVMLPELDATTVRQAIEAALERQAAHRVKDVHVGVDNGVVALTGTVRSWPEREAIYESVSHAPGVRSVINDIQVNPYL